MNNESTAPWTLSRIDTILCPSCRASINRITMKCSTNPNIEYVQEVCQNCNFSTSYNRDIGLPCIITKYSN